MPWIHVDDLCAIYLEAITNTQMNGAYNAAINDNTTIVFSLTHWLRFMGIKSVCPMSQVLIKMIFEKDSIDGREEFHLTN
jgi:NAD dependent epimerase/dehydratase family enzyme